MKIIRFIDAGGREGYGSLQPDGTVLRINGDVLAGYEVGNDVVQVKKTLAPVEPRAFLAIGANYRLHVEESGKQVPEYPILFMKSPGAVQNPGDPIFLPMALRSDKVDFECELAVIIGKTCKNATKANALDYVLGYTCTNDVSARDWQADFGGGQWCRGKTFDTFAPLGPCLVTTDEIPDPNTLRIRTILNGEVMQDANTGDMIFDVPTLVEFLSGSTTLLPGTVILTGTPQGVGMARTPPVWLKPGDMLTVEIEHIGQLTNPVKNEVV